MAAFVAVEEKFLHGAALCGCQQNRKANQAMNKDQVEGRVDQVKGKLQEVAGKVMSDEQLKAEGRANQMSQARCRPTTAMPKRRSRTRRKTSSTSSRPRDERPAR